MPLAWLNRSRVLVATCTSGFLFTLFVTVTDLEGDLGALVVFFTACMLIAAGLAVRRREFFPQSSPIFSFTGFFIYITILLILSFYHRGKGTWSIQLDQFPENLIFFVFALAVVAFWVWAILPVPKKQHPLKVLFHKEYYGVLASFVLIFFNVLGVIRLGGGLGMAVFNILLLYQAVIMIAAGCKELNLKITTTGCVLFAVITFARYTDFFTSLLARSLVFFITGAALFSVGIYYSKTKKRIPRENV
jgi:hypothetical protein